MANLKWTVTNRRLWNCLSDDQKKVFLEPAPNVASHNARIIEGYSSAMISENQLNPYWGTFLYPWEIIKDKLRRRPAYASDIYDLLIQEAFSITKKMTAPEVLHASALEFSSVENDDDLHENTLTKEERTLFELLSQKKAEFLQRRRIHSRARKVPLSPYDQFYQKAFPQISAETVQEKNKLIAEEWKKLNTPITSVTKSASYREKALDVNTAMVMDYIFEYGTVEGFNGNWREWRNETFGSLFYLGRVASPVVVERTKAGVLLVTSDLPLPLDTWNIANNS